jgi:hypothetical protein
MTAAFLMLAARARASLMRSVVTDDPAAAQDVVLVECRTNRALHVFEHVGHGFRIEVRLGQRVDADAVRFDFVGAVKLICICAARPGRSRSRPCRRCSCCTDSGEPRRQRADHRQHHQRRHLLLGLDRADQVVRVMCELRGEHRGSSSSCASSGSGRC